MLTNVFKVALLPDQLFDMAMDIAKRYGEGELAPPSSCKQRQRRSISSSSFSFLKGLDPFNYDDQDTIFDLFTTWLDTKIRPSPVGKVCGKCPFLGCLIPKTSQQEATLHMI